MLAAAARKANRTGSALQIANESAGDSFLGHALGFFSLRADLNHGGAEAANAEFTSQFRIFIGIDVFHLHLGGQIGILIEQVFAVAKARAAIEVGDDCILFEAFRDLGRLLGEAIALVRSRVEGLGVAIGENIGHDDRGNHDQYVGGRIGGVFSLSGLDPLACHHDLLKIRTSSAAIPWNAR